MQWCTMVEYVMRDNVAAYELRMASCTLGTYLTMQLLNMAFPSKRTCHPSSKKAIWLFEARVQCNVYVKKGPPRVETKFCPETAGTNVYMYLV